MKTYGLEEKKQVPFRGTAEQERQLLDFIEEHKQVGGCLMPIMQKAQEIYGYLPEEVQKMISQTLWGFPWKRVYSVSTFYSQFHLMPKGKYEISVCLGTACYVKGQEIFTNLAEQLGIVGGECTPDGKFSLDACRCVGACGLAPVVLVNDEVYGRLRVDDVPAFLPKYETEDEGGAQK